LENTSKTRLIELFERWANEEARSFVTLPQSGSYREYYRISGREKSALGVYNTDEKENQAFVEFTNSFAKAGLPVPEVYAFEPDNHLYLLQDLGDTTLFAFLQGIRKNDAFPDELMTFYEKTLAQLVQFQTQGSKCIDYGYCYPRAAFDRQSMLWDLHYFKYYFLKLARIPFDEQLLEDDFNRFIDFLLEADNHYFLYRDFQSRNIMVVGDEPWFIDYQGGRKGALQYDVASLLYDAKANIPEHVRSELLHYYLNVLSTVMPVDKQRFIDHYYGFVFIRLMQAMGAYGFRGFYEKKEHFLQSIPPALKNLEFLLENSHLPIELPVLMATLRQVAKSEALQRISSESTMLTVTLHSFSFKRGVPIDISGNGGGFVFDCRALHNPGKYDQYKPLTGKDAPVVEFLEKEPDTAEFLKHIYSLVDASVARYLSRGFKHLMVNFGCTGGQHRSVYCAERLAEHLGKHQNVKITLKHVEQEMKRM
jgi:aminoglycoside/choline kinase family phosphotransferase